MPRSVTAYKVFIASPGDVQEERQKAVEMINRWNSVNLDRMGICFLPLLWEEAVPQLGVSPQDAINEQLLDKADYLVGIFSSRIGTATKDYPSGTIEEIEKISDKSRAAVFFSDQPFTLGRYDPDFIEKRNQQDSVRELEKKLIGLNKKYSSADDFAVQFYQTIDFWAQEIQAPEPNLILQREPSHYEDWLRNWNSVAEGEELRAGTVLLYNIELSTFETSTKFEFIWGKLRELPYLKRVVLLLPPYKFRRLQSYLRKYLPDPNLNSIAERLFVCELRMSLTSREPVKSTSIAFALLRAGPDASRGAILAPAYLLPLTEPFSFRDRRPHLGAEVLWVYKYSFKIYSFKVSDHQPIIQDLGSVWDDGFDMSTTRPILDLVATREKTQLPPHDEEQLIDSSGPPSKTQLAIQLLREKAFDPTVPAYLLSDTFLLLDWNSAFEMVFPTSLFYRGESVKQFVECLDNKIEIMATGEEEFIGKAADKRPVFHVEDIYYTSPKYGLMKFTKLGYRVVKDPASGRILGWVVSLNVDSVECLSDYEEDLIRTNTFDDMAARYAGPYENIFSRLPDYLGLIDKHVKALSHSTKILNIPARTGLLTKELLRRGKRVTAVEPCDAMLHLLRKKCGQFEDDSLLSIVKSTVEAIHAPPPLSANRIGIDPRYDAAAILSVIETPPLLEDLLWKLRKEVLADQSVVSIALPKKGGALDYVLEEISNWEFRCKRRKEECWTEDQYAIFSEVTRWMEEYKYIRRFSVDDVVQLLSKSGFEVENLDESVFYSQAIFAIAKPKVK